MSRYEQSFSADVPMGFPVFVLTLLSDYWVFFEDDEIVRDGKHHRITDIQANGAKADLEGVRAVLRKAKEELDDLVTNPIGEANWRPLAFALAIPMV